MATAWGPGRTVARPAGRDVGARPGRRRPAVLLSRALAPAWLPLGSGGQTRIWDTSLPVPASLHMLLWLHRNQQELIGESNTVSPLPGFTESLKFLLSWAAAVLHCQFGMNI